MKIRHQWLWVVSAALLPLLLLQSPELPYRKQELQNIYFLSKLWFTLSVFTISTVLSAECVCSSQMRRCSFMTLRFSRWYGLEEKNQNMPHNANHTDCDIYAYDTAVYHTFWDQVLHVKSSNDCICYRGTPDLSCRTTGNDSFADRCWFTHLGTS